MTEESKGNTGQTGKTDLRETVIAVLKTCYDPEIPVNIHDLGLIYDVDVIDDNVYINMTLTSPHCPVAESLPAEVKDKVKNIEGVKEAVVKVVWEPTWNKDMMSETAKLELGFL